MKNVEIRPLQDSDFESLVEVDNLIWNERNSPVSIFWPTVKAYADQHERAQLVAVVDGAARGFISYKSPTPLPSNQHVWELSIGIHPVAQGFGIGRKLVEALIEKARSHHIQKLSLRVLESNAEAIGFYEALGFKEQGRLVKEFMINGRLVDDVLMYRLID